ncbi:MAG: TIGR00270 family protein [Candidatus Micrarchaeota archaeon]|nr:TIGR00270 family protein [Candidatus Micrarchaeota archaeon]MDE1804238.1 TIGR00270 family protein [Candidatus Micrarchaeota archaeon]
METCEICGKQTEKIYLAQIEGTTMWMCAACSKGKKIVKSVDTSNAKKAAMAQRAQQEENDEIVEHFGEQIRLARERMGLPLRVLAERIAEKESTLVRVEKEKSLPTEALRKKLEKELGVRLAQKPQGADLSNAFGRRAPITLGDAAFTKKKEDEE